MDKYRIVGQYNKLINHFDQKIKVSIKEKSGICLIQREIKRNVWKLYEQATKVETASLLRNVNLIEVLIMFDHFEFAPLYFIPLYILCIRCT